MKTTGILCVLLMAAGLFVSGAGRAQTTIKIGYALATDSHYGVGAAKFAGAFIYRTLTAAVVRHFPQISFTSCLPKFCPLRRPINAWGAFSIPIAMLSRYLSLPS